MLGPNARLLSILHLQLWTNTPHTIQYLPGASPAGRSIHNLNQPIKLAIAYISRAFAVSMAFSCSSYMHLLETYLWTNSYRHPNARA